MEVRRQGMVRQSFSHGRTKAVVVEKVKRRRHDEEAKRKAGIAMSAFCRALPRTRFQRHPWTVAP
jgi:hypothetical protein